MKNVLFATTALVAFAGAAAAEVNFSGSLTAGYNDEIEDGLFFQADLGMDASVDLGDNVTATASVTLFDWEDEDADPDLDADITVEIAYTGDTLSASLKMGDMGDKGASEYFYADRDGMNVDVENHDGDDEVRALVEFGNFGVAVGCDMDGNNNCATSGFNYGAGATFGSIEIGVGYDDDGFGQNQTTAVSADATFGAISVGVSYADGWTEYDVNGVDGNDGDDTITGPVSVDAGTETSIGVAVGYDVSDALSVGVYYASNDYAGDVFGGSVDYTSGALSVSAYFDQEAGRNGAGIGPDADGDGFFAGGSTNESTITNSYGVDVSYAVNDMLTANAGIYAEGDADMVYYVGVDYAVNEAITATVSYATADEISGPEYKDGITALITASF